jgi:hypothetical protein
MAPDQNCSTGVTDRSPAVPASRSPLGAPNYPYFTMNVKMCKPVVGCRITLTRPTAVIQNCEALASVLRFTVYKELKVQ